MRRAVGRWLLEPGTVGGVTFLGRSPVGRQYAFAQEREWRNLDFVQTVGDDFANFFGALNPDGSENPVMATFVKDGDHRLSTPADIDRLLAVVEAMVRRAA